MAVHTHLRSPTIDAPLESAPRSAGAARTALVARSARSRRTARRVRAEVYAWALRRRTDLTRAVSTGRLAHAVSGIVRLAGATALAFFAAQQLLHTMMPITGALTALLVVQATAFATVTTGARRLLAVVLGVLIAVGFSVVLGFTVWSLGIVVATSLAVGRLLRLKDQEIEVAVSAMLILAVSGSEFIAEIRVLETMIGAGVGVAVNLVAPPRRNTTEPPRAVRRLADEVATVLDVAGERLVQPVPAAELKTWSDQLRSATSRVVEAEESVDQLAASRRLNVWSFGRPDGGQPLRRAVLGLEHATVTGRALLISLADLPELTSRRPPEVDADGATRVRDAVASALVDVAALVRAYGDLAVAESTLDAQARGLALERALGVAERLDRRRAELARLLLTDGERALWLTRTPVLAAMARLAEDLDPARWDDHHTDWRAEQDAKLGRSEAVQRILEAPLPSWMVRD